MQEGPLGFEERLTELADHGAEGVCDFVDAVLREGLHRGASDIHVEPLPDEVHVRFRLDGVLHPSIAVRTKCCQNVIARLKVLSDLLTYQTDVPQEGRLNRERIGADGDLRVSTFPTVHGEKVVVRLFDPATQNVHLGDLGYPDAIREQIERHLRQPKGVILLTGPAGSGKTTTIYAAVRYVLEQSGGRRNIVTVEDPVERVLPGVTQTQVQPGTGLTFARCLRSLVRQDPEVIVIGEIRDRETADIAVEAGLTGHLVISTIHSGTAAGVFTRLLEMGVEPHLVTSSVALVVAQRLVRKLCSCKQLASSAWEPAGCERCFGAGFAGRTVLAEALPMNAAMRKLILARAETEAFESAATEQGMRSLRDCATDLTAAGVTSADEVRRVLGADMRAG